MFTVKIYHHDYECVDIRECRAIRRQYLSNGDTEVVIQDDPQDPATWSNFRLRDNSSLSAQNRRKWALKVDDAREFWDFRSRVIVENQNGKTTEIILPNIAPETLPEPAGRPIAESDDVTGAVRAEYYGTLSGTFDGVPASAEKRVA
jgi:hypothetical protein